jgi:hypothetical protein
MSAITFLNVVFPQTDETEEKIPETIVEEPDGMIFQLLQETAKAYNTYIKALEKIHKKINGNGKIRMPNFPSEISENIVKFAYYKIYKVLPTWNTTKGDLQVNGKQLEVKGFMSDGPSSFGPTEPWDQIYFVDSKEFKDEKFKIYEIKLSNNSEIWRNIIISGKKFDDTGIPDIPANIESLNNKDLKELCKKRGLTCTGNKKKLIDAIRTEKAGSKFKKPKTYGEIADSNKRGQLRGSFETIFKPQLGDNCKLIFDGHLSELDNTI